MTTMRSSLPVALALLLASCAAGTSPPASAGPAAATVVEVGGPMIVVFAPAFSEREVAEDEGAASGVSHVELAASDLIDCLGPRGILFRSVVADVVTVVDGGTRSEVRLQETGSAAVAGCLLVRPGKPPQVVRAAVGPSALSAVCADAAAAYFDIPPCE